MDHRLWMYNKHYETGAGLKPEFIDDVRNFIEHTMTLDIFKNNGLPRYFVWIDRGESDELDVAPHGQIRVEQVRVEHDKVHEMINDAFGVQGRMEPKQYFDEAPNEEARRFYYQLEESSHPLCEGSPHFALPVAIICSRSYWERNWRNKPNRNDEGDIDPLFPPISIFNQNGRGSKKRGK
ncbi:hypothetical protein H5410_060393 [Solanum commersonii]|uniref:Uncharacterized protein n=1 Tax=Solanum commersonii TaxID=4109 RepID=A0A9J5W4Y8_SOLCO|nr:hypothetical protein H5410_060393 [Solanum commersonii]